MKLLLDTHALLWSLVDSNRIPLPVSRQISSSSNRVYYSAASIFELAAKRAAGRRASPTISTARVHQLAAATGFESLLVSPEHAAEVENIALFHGDPVDRLLLAQAQLEDMRLVTHDEALAAYDTRTILF